MKLKLIKKGNSKITKACGIFTLPTSICGKACPGCYARKPELRFPVVLAARQRHLQAALSDTFVDDMVKEITASNVSIFRIHESGDFFSTEYADKWLNISAALPNVQFYAFTKTHYADHLNARPNVNIIKENDINYGTKEYCETLQAKGYTLCPCMKGVKLECMKDCQACLTATKVCFIQH